MAAITRQWWRRLVNAHEVKAGMMCLQCKRRASHNGALYKSILLYLPFYPQLMFGLVIDGQTNGAVLV